MRGYSSDLAVNFKQNLHILELLLLNLNMFFFARK